MSPDRHVFGFASCDEFLPRSGSARGEHSQRRFRETSGSRAATRDPLHGSCSTRSRVRRLVKLPGGEAGDDEDVVGAVVVDGVHAFVV